MAFNLKMAVNAEKPAAELFSKKEFVPVASRKGLRHAGKSTDVQEYVNKSLLAFNKMLVTASMPE